MCVILLDEEVFTSSTFGWLMWILLTIVLHSLIQGSPGWGGGTPLFGPMELRAAQQGLVFRVLSL